jgi:hypothetical protein
VSTTATGRQDETNENHQIHWAQKTIENDRSSLSAVCSSRQRGTQPKLINHLQALKAGA